MILLIFLITLFVPMLFRVPIAFALLFSGFSLMIALNNFDTRIMATNLMQGVDSYALLAVPFFILAGELMNAGGISNRIIKFATAYIGHIKGGMGYVAIMGTLLFAGLSGSIIADTAALGAILIPMMSKIGYERRRSTGLIASGGIIAGIIPPSIPLILLGITGDISISKLFIGGIIPGILIGVSLASVWWFLNRNDSAKTTERMSWRERLYTTKDAVWALLMPFIIIIGLRGGVFTPTEAGAVAVAYALFVGIFIYRQLKLKDLYKVLLSATETTSIVVFLIGGAMVTGWLITIANIPEQVIGLLNPFIEHPLIVLLLIALFTLVLGTVMDLTPNVLIMTPVFMPLVTEAGIDPIHFGIVFVYANTLGMLTPPVGTVINVASGVGKISYNNVVKGIFPFFVAEVALLIVFVFIPDIILIPVDILMK